MHRSIQLINFVAEEASETLEDDQIFAGEERLVVGAKHIKWAHRMVHSIMHRLAVTGGNCFIVYATTDQHPNIYARSSFIA